LAPVFILPLFNKFSPLPAGPLKKAIEKYSKSTGFQIQGIYTMDSSKRSTKSNAFFTGFGRFRRLVLFDTLIETQSIEELTAVVAHEVGHFKLKHIFKSMAVSLVSSAALFYSFGLFLNHPKLFEAFQMTQTSTYASLIFIGILYGPVTSVLSIFTQWMSRQYEFEADAYSVKTYAQPEKLISALKKLSVDNLAHLTPHPLKVILDYSHPPVIQRIKAIQRNAKLAR
jgi:STE24 endopeptidase